MKFTRDDTGALTVSQNLTGLEPETWYQVSWWWRTSSGVDSPETRVRIQNTTTSEEVGPDGETWHANGTPYLLETGAFTEWRQYTALFRTTAGHAKTDTFRVILAEVNTGGAGSTIDQYMDDVAIGRADPCVAGETCDEDGDVCVGCSFDADCDDGLFCNGEETCVEGLCQDPLKNGSLDAWAEGVPVYWKKSQQAGTAERESDPAEVRPPGGSAASFTRDADGSLNVSHEMTGFEPETWYRISWWWRASADVDSPQVRLRLQNLTTSEEVGADGETWHPTGSPFLKTSAAFTNWRAVHGVVQDRRHPHEDRHVPGDPGRAEHRRCRIHHHPIPGRRRGRPRRSMHGRPRLRRRNGEVALGEMLPDLVAQGAEALRRNVDVDLAPPDLLRALPLADDELVVGRAAGMRAGQRGQRPIGRQLTLLAKNRLLVQTS